MVDVNQKMNQIKRFIEISTDDSLAVRTIGSFFYVDYYISAEDKQPYMTKKIHKDAVNNIDWSLVVLLLQNAPIVETQQSDEYTGG